MHPVTASAKILPQGWNGWLVIGLAGLRVGWSGSEDLWREHHVELILLDILCCASPITDAQLCILRHALKQWLLFFVRLLHMPSLMPSLALTALTGSLVFALSACKDQDPSPV